VDADALAGWVDPLTGVIPGLRVEQLEENGLPAVVTAAPPHVSEEDGSLRALPAGWGKGLTLADALRSAVGEAIERYSASLPDPARLIRARPGELDGDALDPRLFPLYRLDQYRRSGFPYVPFDPVLEHPWVRGRWLRGGDVWVPAVFAFLALTVDPENLICQGSSNGLAASTEWEDAALRAVLELVERDAMMVTWLTGASGIRVHPDDSLDPSLRAIAERIESLGAAVEVYLLPASVCGTVALSLAVGDGVTWPGVTIGLAADLDPRIALRQALLELGQTGPYLRELLPSGTVRAPEREADVRTMLDHAAYYFPAGRTTAFARLRASHATVRFEQLAAWDGERSLEACTVALERAGIRVALVDVTAPDVATGPFRVVRAVSPDLQPISYGYGFERVPVERIRDRVRRVDRPAIHPIW
jgi:ribosomal protein S12 methylthiotransferase accessory factor